MRAGNRISSAGALLVSEDLREVAVSEPACLRARLERPVHLLGAVELGEVDRLDRLAANALRADRSCLDQPLLGGRADRKERPLLIRAGARPALQRARRPGRVVLIVDRWAARCGQPVPGDFPRSAGPVSVHDDQLLAIGAGPDPLIDQLSAGPNTWRHRH